MTTAEAFQAAYAAFLTDYQSKASQLAEVQAQNALLEARNAALLTLVDDLHTLAHAPLSL
jgi:hypothetical protein